MANVRYSVMSAALAHFLTRGIESYSAAKQINMHTDIIAIATRWILTEGTMKSIRARQKSAMPSPIQDEYFLTRGFKLHLAAQQSNLHVDTIVIAAIRISTEGKGCKEVMISTRTRQKSATPNPILAYLSKFGFSCSSCLIQGSTSVTTGLANKIMMG